MQKIPNWPTCKQEGDQWFVIEADHTKHGPYKTLAIAANVADELMAPYYTEAFNG